MAYKDTGGGGWVIWRSPDGKRASGALERSVRSRSAQGYPENQCRYHRPPALLPVLVLIGHWQATAAMVESNDSQKLCFVVLLVFLFLAFSRIFDVKFGTLHITGIAYRIVFVMVLLSRGFLVALKTNIGKALLGFTICFGLAVPFSVWKSGSMVLFRDSWLTFSFASFLAVGGLVTNYQQSVKVFKTLAYAFFVFAIIANVFGS